MVIPKMFVQLGAGLSATMRGIASGWRSHSPNNGGRLEVVATRHQHAAAQGKATILSAVRSPADGRTAAPLDATLPNTARSSVRVGETALRDGPRVNRTADQVTVCNDPVDVATGEFVLPGTDLRLPGILPLVVKRRHRSGYRFGRWFGPTWSTTLDMRVVVEADTVTFLGEDGLILVYPPPAPGQVALPRNGGPRWTLTAARTGGYAVTAPERVTTWHFTIPDPRRAAGSRDGYVLSAVTDRHGNRIGFRYDSAGAPVTIEHSGGYRVRIDTDHDRITALHVLTGDGSDTADTIRKFGYAAGQLVTVHNGVGAVTEYTYDAEHRMTSWTDSNGNRMRNTYDAAGRVLSQHGSAGILDAHFEYSSDPETGFRRTVHVDSTGARTEYVVDPELRLREHIDAVGGATRFEYDGHRPIRVSAADGSVVRYRYNAAGDPVEIVRPDGRSVLISYGAHRQPATITEVDGTSYTRQFDASGNISTVLAPGGTRTEYTYHPMGALATVTESTGAVTRIDVDPAGLAVRVTDPYGAVTTIARDHFGRPVTVTDALGAVTSYIWSGESELIGRLDPDGYGETRTFDGEGNPRTHTDRAGGRTRYHYGPFDLLSRRSDPDGSTTHYTWDRQRRLTGVTSPLGDTWRYTYDAAGRRTSETDYAGALTRYTYDPCGRVATVTPATGITRTYTYDVLGRPTAVTAGNGDWLRYTYDAAGRMTSAVSGSRDITSHTVGFTYTDDGRPAAQQVDDRPPSMWEYDRHGRRIACTAPSGAVTSWQYDPAGRVIALHAGRHRLDFTHDPLGRTTGWRLGDLVFERGYSETDRPVHQTITRAAGPGVGEPIRRDDYDWRPDGYPTARTTTGGDGPASRQEYALDALGRVTGIVSENRLIEQYSYDPLGNVLFAGTSGLASTVPTSAETTVAVQGHEQDLRREYRHTALVRRGRTRYHYDRSGRLVRSVTSRPSRAPEVRHYRYDAFDQLTELRVSGGERWRYTYDALGRRTAKHRLTADGTAVERTTYTWDGTRLTEQTARGTSTHWTYRPGTHIPLTQTIDRTGAAREFVVVVTDPVGAPVQLLGRSGRIAATATTALWGETTWSGSTHTLLRYPGQQYDPESGLHYNLYRTYDPATGRYLTPDPLGLGAAPNPVTYPHNPTAWSDPLGLLPDECVETRTYRDFAHGTSADHASYIEIFGLKEQVARTASRGGSMARRGSFFTHEVQNGHRAGFRATLETTGGTGGVLRVLTREDAMSAKNYPLTFTSFGIVNDSVAEIREIQDRPRDWYAPFRNRLPDRPSGSPTTGTG